MSQHLAHRCKTLLLSFHSLLYRLSKNCKSKRGKQLAGNKRINAETKSFSSHPKAEQFASNIYIFRPSNGFLHLMFDILNISLIIFFLQKKILFLMNKEVFLCQLISFIPPLLCFSSFVPFSVLI